MLTKEQEESYLRSKGWEKISQTLWHDATLRCKYLCCHEVALMVQKRRAI